jgi:stage IV sporulation protein FB
MFSSGYLLVARWRGIPLRLHWTLPVGAVIFTGLRFVPGAWVGFVLLIVLHELGHALLARRYRMRVLSVDIHGFGGQCRYTGEPTPRQRAVIAWGGVLAQALLFFAVMLALLVAGQQPSNRFLGELADSATSVNLRIAALNLLPFAPLDGAEAWKLPKLWLDERRRRRAKRAVTKPREFDSTLPDEVEAMLKRAMEDARKRAAKKADAPKN